MIDKPKSFDHNIFNLLFSRFGNLIDAPDKMLPTASKDQKTCNTILKEIANRRNTNKEIAEYIGKEPNHVASYLPRLVDNEIIEKRESFVKNQKLNYYEISDNLIRFWYRFVFDNKDEIKQNMCKVIYEDLSVKVWTQCAYYKKSRTEKGNSPDFGLRFCRYFILAISKSLWALTKSSNTDFKVSVFLGKHRLFLRKRRK